MALTFDELAEEALRLPRDSRALLADRIVESLDFTDPDELQKIWVKEAIRRRDEVRSGIVETISGEEVIQEVRRIVGR